MTFDQANEIAAVINGAGDQIINLTILTIAGAMAFVIKCRMTFTGNILIGAGMIFIAAAAILSFINKGLLITMLQKFDGSNALTARLDEVSMFAFLQFASMILGLILLAVGVLFFRSGQIGIDNNQAQTHG